MNYVEKYRPKSIGEIRGQDASVIKIKQLINDGKPILVHGPAGVGKTAAAIALANDMGYDTIEVNASDTRNKASIKSIVVNAAQQQSLFSKGKLILVDELDGIEGTHDRGGLTELASILDGKQKYPIILVANDPWESKFSTVRKKCTMIEFKHLNYLSISSILKNIAEKEDVKISIETINEIARRAAGDARAAINDFEIVARDKKEVKHEDLAIIGTREKEESIFQALRVVFKSKEADKVLGVFNSVDMDMDEIIFWIDENMPLEYKGIDLVKGYNSLSLADIYRGRIRKRQHWRFLAYVSNFITAGIALAKLEKNPGFVGYKRTTRILKMWMAKQKRLKRNGIASKIGKDIHCSTKRVIMDVLPYLKIMYNKKANLEFDLDEDEIEWLKQKA